MRKLLLIVTCCVYSARLFAQQDAQQPQSNVFFKAAAPDTTGNDTLPPFIKHSFGFYFMPASTFNSGTAVAPPYDPNQIGIVGTRTYYSSVGPDKAAFGFSFGADYQSKPFAKRLFYTVGVSMADIKYSGTATLVTVSPNPVYNSTEIDAYSWSALTANILAEFHFAYYQKKNLRLNIYVGAVPNFYISQSHSGDQSVPNYDGFNLVGVSGIGGLGMEYLLGGSLLVKLEPCYSMSFTKSPGGRSLSFMGIEVGIEFK
jgi:hypothetical protein